jgi:hypothetical protein
MIKSHLKIRNSDAAKNVIILYLLAPVQVFYYFCTCKKLIL